MKPCMHCHQLAAHLTDTGMIFVCDECILSGEFAWLGLTEPANPGIDCSQLGKITVRAVIPDLWSNAS